MNIPSKKSYLILNISFFIYVHIVDIGILEARYIGVRATFIFDDIKYVAAILVRGRHI